MTVYHDILAKAREYQRRNGNSAKAASPAPVNRIVGAAEPEVADDLPLEGVAEWPAPLGPAASPGLLGDILGTIGPETEADPAALLVHNLVFYGSCINRTAYFPVGRTRHHTNLFALAVGPTSEGRKGTARDDAARLFSDIDPEWLTRRCPSGLATGEGLIHAVRDPSFGEPGQDGKPGSVVDPGVTDKRLCVFEAEYAAPLRLMCKQGSTLGATLRSAWDRGELANLSKNSGEVATGAHISVIGHISVEELRAELNTTDAANGFINRHLLVMVRRARVLPEGGNVAADRLVPLVRGLRAAVEFGRTTAEVCRDAAARAHWESVYDELSTRGPGLLGAVLGRAEPQVARLSLVYALLDRSRVIGDRHLCAALEFWRYCAESGRFIFGERLGDPLADKVLGFLRSAVAGLTRGEIFDKLSHNVARERITGALRKLAGFGQVRQEIVPTSGRPIERWHAIRRAGLKAFNESGVGGCVPAREREPGEELGQ